MYSGSFDSRFPVGNMQQKPSSSVNSHSNDGHHQNILPALNSGDASFPSMMSFQQHQQQLQDIYIMPQQQPPFGYPNIPGMLDYRPSKLLPPVSAMDSAKILPSAESLAISVNSGNSLDNPVSPISLPDLVSEQQQQSSSISSASSSTREPPSELLSGGTIGNQKRSTSDIKKATADLVSTAAARINSRPRRKSSVSSRDGRTVSDAPALNKQILQMKEAKNAAGEIPCRTCGKRYKNLICLQKHAWEHHKSWNFTKRLLHNKHQSVQIMEAAHTLINITTGSRAQPDLDEVLGADGVDLISEEFIATESLSPGSDVSYS